MRTVLAFGLPAVAPNIGWVRQFCRGLLDWVGHEAGQGNLVAAAVLVDLYPAGV